MQSTIAFARNVSILLVTLLLSPVSYGQSPTAEDLVARAIGNELDALMSPDVVTIQSAYIALGPQLHDFYSRRSFRPAWSKRATAQQMLKAIADSYADGLDPADYHASVLQSLAMETDTSSAPAAALAQFDILLTEALMRLSYHLTFGKVDPESFDAQWNYSRTLAPIDVAATLEEIIASGDVYARLDAMRPTHKQYKRIKHELARYRGLAPSQEVAIPAGPSLRLGDSDLRVVTLRARLKLTGELLAEAPIDSTHFDVDVENALKLFQQRMGLTADGVAGKTTLQELNVPIATRILQLRVSLDRGRVLLHDLPNEFVVVNVAGYSVALIRGDDIVWNARAQVGKTYRQTPIFRSTITYLVLNPTWTVPPGIIQKDILPDARRNPNAFSRRGLRVLDRDGRDVDPTTVDWSRFKTGHIPYTLRQDPGPTNALGRVKFMFPNSYQVYLHDTPSKGLFDRDDRSFSSGCVRVERALDLAELLLQNQNGWDPAAIARTIDRGELQNITLSRKIPVLLTYWTAWVDAQDRVNFRRDIYGQDAQWAAGLDEDFKVRKRPFLRAE